VRLDHRLDFADQRLPRNDQSAGVPAVFASADEQDAVGYCGVIASPPSATITWPVT
jgi:hypothetical protein